MAASSSMMSTVPMENDSSRPAAYRLIIASGIDDLSDHGEFHGEGCAVAGRAVDVDLAGMLLNDAVGHGKTQTGATAVSALGLALRGEERIIDAVDVLLRNAAARIRDDDTHIVTVAGGDSQRSAGRHGVFCVEEQVQENLLQLAGVAEYRRQLRVQIRHYLYACSLELMLQERQRILNYPIQIDIVELSTRGTREVQQAIDDLRRTERLLGDLLQQFGLLGVGVHLLR